MNEQEAEIVVRELHGEKAAVNELLGVVADNAQPRAVQPGVLYVLRLAQLNSRIARVIYRLKHAHQATAIILLLDHCSDDAAISSFAAGADDILVQPVNDTLLGIKVMLQSNALSQQIERLRENAALMQRIRDLRGLAFRDPVLDIPNRRAFERALTREWSRHRRSRRPLSLVFADLDHFKTYNDTFGHPSGDEALSRVAARLQQSVQRETDLVCRYGGDEFVVLLSDTDARGARAIANRMRNAVLRMQLGATANGGRPLSLSCGVACLVPTGDDDAGMLVNLADEALYDAKSAGRNTVHTCGTPIIALNGADQRRSAGAAAPANRAAALELAHADAG